jgi:dTDP-4-dehydrorhamnose reductase
MTARRRTALVLGARGTLGVALCQELERLGWAVAARGHAECDIRDPAAVGALVASASPAAVFNAAAYTDVDRAESSPSWPRP